MKFRTEFDEIMDIAKSILKELKREDDAQMVANSEFERFMINFTITDGERIISADVLDDYFVVNDGDREIHMSMPCLQGARRKIYDLGLSFLKKRTYTVGAN